MDARSHELEAEGSKKGVPERLEKRPSEEDHCSKERQLKLREEEVARRERELKRMKMEMTNLQIEVDKVKRRLCSLEREEEDREEVRSTMYIFIQVYKQYSYCNSSREGR